MVSAWRIDIRDAALGSLGRCDVWTDFQASLTHRGAGGWTLRLPASHEQASRFTEGGGIVVWAPWSDGTPFLSGPVTRLTATTPGSTSAAVLEVQGVDDTALLADRLVLPDPSSAMDDQGTDAYYTDSGPAGAVMRRLVDWNAGNSALTARRLCDADPDGTLPGGVGSTRNVRARFDNLLSTLAAVASTDNLGFRLFQPAGVLDRHLEVFTSVDRTASVRLSQPAGTLNRATLVLSAPGATNVLVAGGGEETARVLVERSDAALVAEWSRRVETFRDARDTVDLTELGERGDEALADARATASVSAEPVDTPAQGFGTHYGLGDTVTVEVGGLSYAEIVTSVAVTVNAAGGTTVTPAVGNAEVFDPLIYGRVRQLTRRLEALERRQ